MLLGAVILIFMTALLLTSKRLSSYSAKLSKLASINIVILILLSLKFSAFGPEYLLPVWMLFLFLIPIAMEKTFSNKTGTIIIGLLILFNLFSSARELNNNHGYNMPAGWTMEKINLTGKIISNDSYSHGNFNVASLLDGGTRAYPIRYTTIMNGRNPDGVENYPASNFLYVVSSSNQEELYKNKTWEIESLNPFTIGKKWYLGDNIYLYRLDRTKTTHE